MTIIEELTRHTAHEEKMNLRGEFLKLPSEEQLRHLIELVRKLVFPDFFGCEQHIPSYVAEIKAMLLRFTDEVKADNFIGKLPEIKHLLLTDLSAIAHNDPAVQDYPEIIVSYPGMKMMNFYRTAHAMHETGIRTLPRMLTEIAHSETGIDIHPAAKIGEYFAIDHGTGIVVGETCVIGNHVMLYQGVTLGAKNFQYDEKGIPLNIPRHPVLEDNVTVYSNTSILGRVTIGHDTIIGGNVWLTHDVPAHSKIVQTAAVSLAERQKI